MKLETLDIIVNTFNRYRVKFLIVGGVAVVAHGYGRLTYDLDLVIKINKENILALFEALQELNYHPSVPVNAEQFADIEIRNQWTKDKGMVVLNFFSEKYNDTPVDIFVNEPFDFDVCHENAIEEEITSGNVFRYVNIPTLISMKLAAGREKDKDDVEHLRIIESET